MLYALNPLVIVEFSGNLHFECLMIFFLAAAFYFFLNRKFLWFSLLFCLAVNVKLLPLMLLPFLLLNLNFRQGIQLITLVALFSVLLLIPFFNSSLFDNYFESLQLYFQNFEFNAGIYFIARWVGYKIVGYNAISTIGKAHPIIVFIVILIISWKNRKCEIARFFVPCLMIWTTFFACSTTVHPWYICAIVFFSIFTKYRFSMLWAVLLPLTYIAYLHPTSQENLWIVAAEYSLVFGLLGYEIFLKRRWANRNFFQFQKTT